MPPGETTDSAFGFIDYGVLIVYFALLIGMGVYFSRRGKDTETFFLGGRKIPWWAVGLSIFGTSLSAITYISIPATAFAGDWHSMPNNFGILVLAPIIVAWYIPRLRQAPIVTAYEYLENRFNLATRIYGSVVFGAFQVMRMSIVLFLPSLALSAATGIDIRACIILMGILATVYTVLGGIEAVIWTDVIQSFVLVVGAIIALVIVVQNVDGGVGTVLTTAYEAEKFHTFNWSWDITTAAVWVVVIGGIFGGAYPAIADQTVVQRYLSTASAKEAGKAVWANALLTIPIQFLFFSLGTALWVFYHFHPEQWDASLKNDVVLPLFVVQQFPIGLRGVLIAGLFAASMSSLDSSMNSLSSVFINDYYRRFKTDVDEGRALFAARVLTLVFGIFGTLSALFLTTADVTTLFLTFLSSLGLIGGGLAGIFVLGIFTRRANGFGAITGGVAGSTFVVTVKYTTQVHFMLYGMIGLLVAVTVGYCISLVAHKYQASSRAK